MQHLGPPGEPGRLQVVYGEGRGIVVTPSGARVTLDDGRCFAGDVAVLATGHDEAAHGGPTCYVNPWESPAASGIDPDSAVLIRGTGLTMVDFVVSLRAAGHRGPITPCRGAGSCRRRTARLPPSRSIHATFRSVRASSRFGAGCAAWPRTRWRREATGAASSTASVPILGRSGGGFPSTRSNASSATRVPIGKCTVTAWRPRSTPRSSNRCALGSSASSPPRHSMSRRRKRARVSSIAAAAGAKSRRSTSPRSPNAPASTPIRSPPPTHCCSS